VAYHHRPGLLTGPRRSELIFASVSLLCIGVGLSGVGGRVPGAGP